MFRPMNKAKIIRELREEAARLNKAADLLENNVITEVKPGDVLEAIKDSNEDKLTRKEQIIKTLKTKGHPLKLKDIAKITGIPMGTVSATVSKRNGFRRVSMGQWSYPTAVY